MERLAIEISVALMLFLIGYKAGFHACYDYLMEELKNHKKDSD